VKEQEPPSPKSLGGVVRGESGRGPSPLRFFDARGVTAVLVYVRAPSAKGASVIRASA